MRSVQDDDASKNDEPHFLDEVWTLYFHEPSDDNWTMPSYLRVCDISSIEDYAAVRYALKNNVSDGMFFLMREHVFPCWDDKNNLEGGCVSIKLPKKGVETFWHELCVRVLSETLAKKSEDAQVINGVSVSPKLFYSIVKIWLAEERSPSDFDIPPGFSGEIVFKRSRDFIKACQTSARLHPVAEPSTA